MTHQPSPEEREGSGSLQLPHLVLGKDQVGFGTPCAFLPSAWQEHLGHPCQGSVGGLLHATYFTGYCQEGGEAQDLSLKAAWRVNTCIFENNNNKKT